MVTSAGAPQETELIRRNEKKSRRLWKSFSLEAGEDRRPGDDLISSDGAAVKEVRSSYGEVVPAIRYQLAEQGNTEAQLELARELLMKVAGEGEAMEEEEVRQLEERAMYWLLRAAEQGDTEALQTVRALSGQGRGVTDQNYVDVVSISTLPEHVIQAGYLGRKLFRSLNGGQDFVTTLQISRLVEGEQGLPSHPQGQAKHSQGEVMEACSHYMRGDLPSIIISEDSSVVRLLTSRLLILTVSVLVYLYQLTSLQVSLWTSLTTFTSLSALTALSLTTLQTSINQQKFKTWSSIIQLHSDNVDTENREMKFLTRQNLIPFVLTFSLLSIPGYGPRLNAQEPLVWSFCFMAFTGCLSSALSIPKVSRSFLVFMVLSVVCSVTELDSLASNLLPAEHQPKQGQLVGALSLIYFLPSLLLQPSNHALLELQATIWESVVLSALTGGGWPTGILVRLLPLVLLVVTLRDLSCLTLRQWVVSGLCLALLAGRLTDFSVEQERPGSSLTWPQYRAVCLASNLTPRERAVCQGFTGLGVQWSGQVHSLRVRERNNRVETALSYLPDTLRLWANVDCVLGERYGDCHKERSPAARLLCESRTEAQLASIDSCHLESFSSYHWHLTLAMAGSGSLFGGGEEEVTVITQDSAVLNLRPGQRIAVTGRLNTKDLTATVLDSVTSLSVLS